MLLFDLDGTLIDSNGVWKEVDRTFLARRGLPYTHADYQGVAHTILPLAAKFTREFCHLEESCEDIIAEWMDLAKDAYAHVELKPGVRAYLKQCRAEGRHMAIVTSSVPEHCRTALERLDLMKYFDHITYAYELGLEKKEPAIWIAAAEAAGVVGGLQEGEIGRKVEALVHVEGADELLGHQIASRVAGHHQTVEPLVIKTGLAKEGGEAVDAGGEVGGEGVVVVGAEHHQGVAAADGGDHRNVVDRGDCLVGARDAGYGYLLHAAAGTRGSGTQGLRLDYGRGAASGIGLVRQNGGRGVRCSYPHYSAVNAELALGICLSDRPFMDHLCPVRSCGAVDRHWIGVSSVASYGPHQSCRGLEKIVFL